MPIKRFADLLERTGTLESYSKLLYDSFNPATVEQLMCRSLVSISWDGYLYDCDFNQMLEIPARSGADSQSAAPRLVGTHPSIQASEKSAPTIWDIDSFDALAFRPIATAGHCFGCTAGAGSSCGGTLA